MSESDRELPDPPVDYYATMKQEYDRGQVDLARKIIREIEAIMPVYGDPGNRYESGGRNALNTVLNNIRTLINTDRLARREGE